MRRYFFKRTISGVINFFFIMMACFICISSVRGDVASGLMPLETKKYLRELYGLDKSKLEQFWMWLSRLLKGNMGTSYIDGWDVQYEVNKMFIKTIEILIPAIIVATIITIFLGAILHMKKRSAFTELVVRLFCYIGISIPAFLLAKFVIMFFTGEGSIQDYIGKSQYNLISTGSHFQYFEFKLWIIPCATLTLVTIAQLFKYLDSLLGEVMNSEFIRMARSKGLKDKTVMYRHAIRYTACPFITAISLSFIGLMSSQFVIEIVTQWNGLGSGLFTSISYRDYPTTMGILLYITLMILIINMVVDFIYSLLDPRIKLEG